MSDYIKPVVFKVGNEMYGVDINLVQSIEREIQVVPVPNSMPYIKGIVNLRSEVIPVYSLKKKFGLVDNGVSENTIIIDTKNVKLALEVDEVVEIPWRSSAWGFCITRAWCPASPPPWRPSACPP